MLIISVCGIVVFIYVCIIQGLAVRKVQMELTLLSLSIKVFEFEFEFLMSYFSFQRLT